MLDSAIYLLILGGIIGYIHQYASEAWNFLTSFFVTSVTFKEHDEAFNWISEWLAQHRSLEKMCNNIQAKVKRGEVGDDNADWRTDRAEKMPRLIFTPAEGSHILIHKGKLVFLQHCTNESKNGGNVQRSQSTLKLTVYGSHKQFLQDIVTEAMNYYLKSTSNKVLIFQPNEYADQWDLHATKEFRPMHTVVLEETIKTAILDDVHRFLSSRKWYNDHGIPYRRGYLLHGPPGTGKTSFILALACHLKKIVCVVQLSNPNLNDNMLSAIYNKSPNDAIIVFEDIDAAFAVANQVSVDSKQENQVANRVTFSGLLNCLDGIATKEGAIVFMTTNHPEKLSKALIRPGRIDKKFCIDKPSKAQLRLLFRNYFPDSPKYEDKFVENIPAHHFSMAEMQSLFLEFHDPADMMVNMKGIIQQLEDQRLEDQKALSNQEEAGSKADDPKTD